MTSGRRVELTRMTGGRLLALAREIAANRRRLSREWADRLAAAGTVIPPGPDWSVEDYVARGGGIRIPSRHQWRLGKPGEAFFADRVTCPDGWTYLRGFSYYAADGAMYLPDRVPPAWRRWELVQRRWWGYAAHGRELAMQVSTLPVGWYRWLAWLAFLEAVLNDLCAAWWSAAYIEDDGSLTAIDGALGSVAHLLAEAGWHLWNDPDRVRPQTWASRIAAVVEQRRLIVAILRIGVGLAGAQVEPWAVRAIREGDEAWLVAAAMERSWPVVRNAHPGRGVLLASEAFGALAAGPLWAAMLPREDRRQVRLAVSRSSVHEDEMGRVPAQSWRTGGLDVDGRVVIHVDDSVFTGRTHDAFRRKLVGAPEAVYLAALTFDVGTPVNHPEEITVLGMGVDEHLDLIEAVTRGPSGQLPAATSMWARRKDPGPHDASVDGVFAKVTGGSDRLLALLWQRYAKEIRRA